MAEQFIFVTGDGHFHSAATFIRSFNDKTIGVYGVAGSISNLLRDCSTWTMEINAIEPDELELQTNLLNKFREAEERGVLYPSFRKTIEIASQTYGGDPERYGQVLSKLITDGYVTNETITLPDHSFRSLRVDWHRVSEGLLGLPEFLRKKA